MNFAFFIYFLHFFPMERYAQCEIFIYIIIPKIVAEGQDFLFTLIFFFTSLQIKLLFFTKNHLGQSWLTRDSYVHILYLCFSGCISFPRPAWVRLHRLRTGVRLFRLESTNGVWLLRRPVSMTQTGEHVITSCPIYHNPNGARALSDVDKNLATSLMETYLTI